MSNMKGFAKKVHLLLVDHSMSQKKRLPYTVMKYITSDNNRLSHLAKRHAN